VTAATSWVYNPDGTITIHTALSRNFVDNTYGTEAIGWPNGHKFGDLAGSSLAALLVPLSELMRRLFLSLAV
jgi:hypothetical protein